MHDENLQPLIEQHIHSSCWWKLASRLGALCVWYVWDLTLLWCTLHALYARIAGKVDASLLLPRCTSLVACRPFFHAGCTAHTGVQAIFSRWLHRPQCTCCASCYGSIPWLWICHEGAHTDTLYLLCLLILLQEVEYSFRLYTETLTGHFRCSLDQLNGDGSTAVHTSIWLRESSKVFVWCKWLK